MLCDADGNLEGDRRYSLTSIILPRHPKRRYFLANKLCRFFNWRDADYLFNRCPELRRLYATPEDKAFLEENGYIQVKRKYSVVCLVACRDAYHTFGHKIIQSSNDESDDWPSDVEFTRDEHESEFVDVETYHPRQSLAPSSMADATDAANTASEPISQETRDSLLALAVKSAHAYNTRLSELRGGSSKPFYDIHTGQKQYPRSAFPSSVSVQMKRGADTGKRGVEVDEYIAIPRADARVSGICRAVDPATDSKRWKTLVPSLASKRHAADMPLALMPGQKRMTVSLYVVFSLTRVFLVRYPARFTHQDALRAQELAANPVIGVPGAGHGDREESGDEYDEDDVSPPARCGAKCQNGTDCKVRVTSVGQLCLRHAQVEANKAKMKEFCCHCLERDAPAHGSADAAIPPELVLECSKCLLKHHPACIDITVAGIASRALAYDWHCGACKMCLECEQAGEEEKMMFCDSCDRGFHTYCLDPPLENIPDGNWTCSLCSRCISCDRSYAKSFPAMSDGGRPPVYLCTYCETCHKQFLASEYCPICMRVYSEAMDNAGDAPPMVCCDVCDRWIHVECDKLGAKPVLESEREDLPYTCIVCDSQRLSSYTRAIAGREGSLRVGSVGGKPVASPLIVTLPVK